MALFVSPFEFNEFVDVVNAVNCKLLEGGVTPAKFWRKHLSEKGYRHLLEFMSSRIRICFTCVNRLGHAFRLDREEVLYLRLLVEIHNLRVSREGDTFVSTPAPTSTGSAQALEKSADLVFL
jgi:hypothetical protein